MSHLVSVTTERPSHDLWDAMRYGAERTAALLCPHFRAETAPRQSCVTLPAALWPPKLALAATALPPILPSAELIFAATAQPPKLHWRRRRSRQSYVRLAATTWAPMTNTRLC